MRKRRACSKRETLPTTIPTKDIRREVFGFDVYFEFATPPSKNAVIGGSKKKKHTITEVNTSIGHCGERQINIYTNSITILFDD